MKIKNFITVLAIISFIISACGKKEEKINLEKTKKSKKQITHKKAETNHVKSQTNIISIDTSKEVLQKNDKKPSQYEIIEQKHSKLVENLNFDILSDKEIKSIFKNLLKNNSYEEIKKFLQSENAINLETDYHYTKYFLTLYSNLIENASSEEERYNAQLNLGAFYNINAFIGNLSADVAEAYLKKLYNNLPVNDDNNIPNYIVNTKALAMLKLVAIFRIQNKPLKDMFQILDETKKLDDLTEYNPTYSYEESFYNKLANEALVNKNKDWSKFANRIFEFLERHPNNKKYDSLRNILK